jgi:membrane-bound lytic murein transglycosylase B
VLPYIGPARHTYVFNATLDFAARRGESKQMNDKDHNKKSPKFSVLPNTYIIYQYNDFSFIFLGIG